MARRPKSQTPLRVRRRRRIKDADDLTYTLLGPVRRLNPEGQRIVAQQMATAEAILAARRMTRRLVTEMEGYSDENTDCGE